MFRFVGVFLLGVVLGAVLIARFHIPYVTATTVQPAAAPTFLVVAPTHAANPAIGAPLPALITAAAAIRCGRFTESRRTQTERLRTAPSAVRVQLLKCSDQAKMQSLHGLFAAEQRDAEWAESMEQHLKSDFARDAPLLQVHLGPIQCRRTICEIQASGPSDMDAVTWDQEVGRMSQEAWWTFTIGASTAIQRHEHSLMLTVLRRPPPVLESN